MLNMGK